MEMFQVVELLNQASLMQKDALKVTTLKIVSTDAMLYGSVSVALLISSAFDRATLFFYKHKFLNILLVVFVLSSIACPVMCMIYWAMGVYSWRLLRHCIFENIFSVEKNHMEKVLHMLHHLFQVKELIVMKEPALLDNFLDVSHTVTFVHLYALWIEN